MKRIRQARWPVLLAALVALKFGLLLVDGKPSIFMGDSGSYLYTALHDYIPHDRSFAFGYLLRALAVWPHSLRFFLFAQGAMSAITAWLIAVILTRVFSVRFRWAALLSFLCALEPLQLLSERYIMTDTVALFLFAALVTVSVAFCRHCTALRLACALVLGVALISIRMSYLAIVLLNSALLPLIWFLRSAPRRNIRAWALLIFWICAGQLMFYGYRCLNAYVSDMAKPEYLYADGFILVSEVSPILQLSDFPPDLPGRRILARVGPSLRNPMDREGQIFSPNGLTWVLRREIPDEYRANQMARRIALHAILAHPGALLELAFSTWEEFFNSYLFQGALAYDEGGLRNGEENFRAEILKSLGTDLGAQSSRDPIARWHRAAIPWYWFLVTAPFAVPLVFLIAWRRMDAAAALVHGYLLLLSAQVILLSTHSEPRYLMSVAWLTLISIGWLSRNFHKRPPLQGSLRDLQVVQADVVESP